MSLVNKIQTAFTAGELSPALWNRPDLAKFQVGAKSLQNCFVHIEGGASNRSGLRFVHDLGEPCKFIPFEYNNEQTYQLAFYEGKVMFLVDGEIVVDGQDPYVIDSPYAYADLSRIKYAQQADTLILRHSGHPERALIRFGATDWAFVDRTSSGGPYLTPNTDRGNEISLYGTPWSETDAYVQGDVVQVGTGGSKAINGATYVYWKIEGARIEVKYYLLRLTLTDLHGFGVDDQIYVDGMTGSDGHSFDGLYSVVRIGADYIEINTGRVISYYNENDYALPDSYPAGNVSGGAQAELGFYVCTQSETNASSPWQMSTVDQSGGAGTDVRLLLDWMAGDLPDYAVVGAKIKISNCFGLDGVYEIITSVPDPGGDYIEVQIDEMWDDPNWSNIDPDWPGTFIEEVTNINKDPVTETDYWRKTYSQLEVHLNSPIDLFSADDVGRSMRLQGPWATVWSEEWDTAGGESVPIPAYGKVVLETGGGWGGKVRFLKSLDDGVSWQLIEEFPGLSASKNHLYNWEATEPNTLVKIEHDGWSDIDDASNEFSYSLDIDNGNKVPMHITSFTDARNVTARLDGSLLYAFTTYDWEYGAWGSEQGHPGAVAIFQQRTFHARTDEQGMALWGSQTGNYTNFLESDDSLATEAISLDLSLSKSFEIRHLVPLKSLLILTSGSWHSLAGSDGGLTPTNAEPVLHGYGGVSDEVEPLINGLSVLVVQDDGRSVSEIRYSLAADGYDRQEMGVLSRHLFNGLTIRSWAKQEDPHNLVFAVMSDGSARCFTFLREQEVWAWTPLDTEGEFIDVGSVKSGSGNPDDVYFLVKREIDGQDKYYIEYLTDRDEHIFLDSCLSHSGAPAITIGGLGHLEGKTVNVLADGAVVRGLVVSETGTIDLPTAASVVHVGLPYASDIETLSLELQESTSSFGRKKVVRKVVAYVADSKGFRAGSVRDKLGTPNEWKNLGSGETFDGEIELRVKGDWNTSGGVVIEQTDPLPMTVLGIVPFMERGE